MPKTVVAMPTAAPTIKSLRYIVVILLVFVVIWNTPLVLAQTEVPVNFVKGNGAEVTQEDIDNALKKLNDDVFKKCDIKFTSKSLNPINDATVPQNPLEGGQDKWTKDMQDVEKAGRKAAGVASNELVVIIVDNFKNPNGPHPRINGITSGTSILIADPFSVGQNTLGGVEFFQALGHELGHALGLGHKLLKSDEKIENQVNGEYGPPNLMAREGATDNTQLTDDQCDELKKGAKKFENKK